jgi:aspartate kinase
MRVLKFGGTSVGSAERMHALVDIINDGVPKIVVLSAMSGTTNNLVEISNALHAKDNDKAKKLIDTMHNKYKEVVKQLYKTEKEQTKGNQLIDSHFDYLRDFIKDVFTVNDERAILAQGELPYFIIIWKKLV